MEEPTMFCECGTPYMLTYSPHLGWRKVCVRCGGEGPATAPSGIPEKAGEQAQMGFSAFASQDFGHAEQCFKRAIRLCKSESSYRWALLLARYGIRYCRTPVNEGTAFMYTVTYWKQALPKWCMGSTKEYAELYDLAGLRGADWSRYYKAECERIDAGLRQIRRLEREGEGCDIFLCYKDTNEALETTPERALLDMLYPLLIQRGLRVFYAPQSMRGRPVYDYEGVIHRALSTARMMVIVASTPENVRAPWVESEWMRFLNWDREQRKKVLTCALGGMSPGQFPPRLCSIQSDLRASRVDQEIANGLAEAILNRYLRQEEPPDPAHRRSGPGIAAVAALLICACLGGVLYIRANTSAVPPQTEGPDPQTSVAFVAMTPTPTAVPTATPTIVLTPTPTAVPTPTPTVEPTPTPTPARVSAIRLAGYNSSAKQYNYVYFGHFSQETYADPILWRVLTADSERALLLSERILYTMPFGETNEWETSDVRTWLNVDFVNSAFTADERRAICPGQTQDNVFLLSLSEATRAEYGFSTKGDTGDRNRIARGTSLAVENNLWINDENGAASYYLRSKDGKSLAMVRSTGVIGTASVTRDNVGIRPTMWVYTGQLGLTGGDGTINNPYR